MPPLWQEHFLEKLVAAAHATGDERLATAALHRRKKTASFQHAQVRSLECSFSGSRNSGSQAQVLLVECQPKRGTEIDGPCSSGSFTTPGAAAMYRSIMMRSGCSASGGMGPKPYSRFRMHAG